MSMHLLYIIINILFFCFKEEFKRILERLDFSRFPEFPLRTWNGKTGAFTLLYCGIGFLTIGLLWLGTPLATHYALGSSHRLQLPLPVWLPFDLHWSPLFGK